MNKPFPVAVMEAVLNAGVNEFVICAGARNSALIIVLAALEKKVRLWRHFDERAAGFFAIGRIRATAKPVAVVTTSGTAVAELLPAVIEAHYQGLPLVALTADRPIHYRGSGAPQAIEQQDLFKFFGGDADIANNEQLAFHEVFSLRQWDRLTPFHINVCLEEPGAGSFAVLRPTEDSRRDELQCQLQFQACADPDPQDFRRPWIAAGIATSRDNTPSPPSADRLVFAGELLADEIPIVAGLVNNSGALVCAEAASGLRDLPELQHRLLRCGDATLRHLPIHAVWRFGGVPSFRFWRDLEELTDVKVKSFSRSGYSGLARIKEPADFNGFPLVEYPVHAGEYLARDSALYAQLSEILAQFPTSEPAIFRRLSQIIPNGATVFTGNSLPIREWNLCAEYGRGHRVHVLRGANGIDGNLSAFLGIAADKEEAWCIVGDLTALYDLNSPWMLRQLAPGKRRFVVIQNDGGKIFSRLPALRELNERERELMENPHDVSLCGWAEMWGMDYVRGGAELLNNPGTIAALRDHAVIELYPNGGATESFWHAWVEAEKEVWS